MNVRKEYIWKTAIGIFFFWHAFVIGVAGIGNTMKADIAVKMRQNIYYKVDWYTDLIAQNRQNWGFFSFVPSSLIRFTFEEWDGENWIVLHEYKLPDKPYIGRHNEFNFLRSIARKKDEYKHERVEYIKRFCKKNNITDTKVYLRKKYAALPTIEDIPDFTWKGWEPEWKKFTMSFAECS